MSDNVVLPYVSAFLTLLIGSAAWYLGFRQQQTNALRLKHELFERRYKIYDTVRFFIGSVLRDGKTSYDACITFLRDTNQAEFLFGPEIPEYLDAVYKKGLALLNSNRQLHSEERLSVGEERTRVARENSELLKWFSDQFDVTRERFGKYLNLTRLE
jgi:hypothetical protein